MTPTMPPDSHKISLKIIEAIRQHPVLYINDVKGTSIKVQEFRQKVWKRISDDLTLDPTWVRLRWKNLRDTYCRILKYKNKTDKGGRRKKWVFEDHLSFLKFPYEPNYQPQCVELSDEYIQEINNGGTDCQGLLEQLEDREDDDYSEYLEVLEETTADPILEDCQLQEICDNSQRAKYSGRAASESESKTSQQQNMDEYVQRIQSKFRKIRPKRMKLEEPATTEVPNSYSILKSPAFRTNSLANINGTNVEPASASSLVTTRPPVVSAVHVVSPPETVPNDLANNSSTDLFFSSMARTVKLLPLKAQVEIKMAVCKIVTEAEMKHSKSNSSSKNVQRFVTPPGMIPKLVLVPCSMIDKAVNSS